MMEHTPEEICAATDEAVERFAAVAKQANEIATDYAKKCGAPDDFRNPFELHYEFERLCIDKIQHDAAVHVIRTLQKALAPNVPMDPEQVLRALRESDKSATAANLLAHIQKECCKDAARLSRDAIHKAARHLLPHAAWKDEANVGEILKGNALALRKHISQSYGAYYSHGEDVEAFQKFVRLIVEEADPVTVDVGPVSISAIQFTRKNDDLLQEITLPEGPISKVRFFKNGKLLVTFKAATVAQRVAEALIQKPAEG